MYNKRSMYYNNFNLTKERINLISIKDYAKKKGVSYEAVRKQVIRYKSDLEGHITKVNRTQFLDDEAVSFLDTKRQENSSVGNSTKESKITELEEQNKELLLKISSLQDELLKAQEMIKELQDEKINQKEIEIDPEQEDNGLEREESKKSWWKNLFK